MSLGGVSLSRRDQEPILRQNLVDDFVSLLHNTTPVFYDWTVSQLSTVWHAFYRLERIFLRHLDTGARRWTMAMLIRGEMGGNELEGRPPPGIMKRYV